MAAFEYYLPATAPAPAPPLMMRSTSMGNKPFSTRSPLVDDVEIENSGISRIPTLNEAFEVELKNARQLNHNVEVKKLRRTISNRLSAMRARQKRAQYIAVLDARIKELKDNIAVMSPLIAKQKTKQEMLQTDNNTLEEKLDNCIVQSNICNKEIEENKHEVKRLQEVQKMNIYTSFTTPMT